MREYEELVERLHKRIALTTAGSSLQDDLLDAADAIEELRKQVASCSKSVASCSKWIMVKSRPMDEEERKEWSERIGYDLQDDEAVIYTSELPDDGQEVIVCSKWGHVWLDTFSNDPDYGVGFEGNGDMDGIVAWMPLPEPPKEE